MISVTMNSAMKIKNRTFAMPADAAAIPPNPKTAAISATTRNVSAQLSMVFPFI